MKVCQTTNIHVDGSNPLDTYVHTTSDDDERKYVAMENAGPDFKWYPCQACAGSQADGRSTCAPCLNDNERGRCGPAAGQCTVNGVPTTTVNSLPIPSRVSRVCSAALTVGKSTYVRDSRREAARTPRLDPRPNLLPRTVGA